jgi:hypothetical protein
LICRNFKIKVYRIISLPFVVYGCETWSPTLRKDRRLNVFVNRVLRRMFGPKRDEVTWSGGNYIMRSFLSCTPHTIFFG